MQLTLFDAPFIGYNKAIDALLKLDCIEAEKRLKRWQKNFPGQRDLSIECGRRSSYFWFKGSCIQPSSRVTCRHQARIHFAWRQRNSGQMHPFVVQFFHHSLLPQSFATNGKRSGCSIISSVKSISRSGQ